MPFQFFNGKICAADPLIEATKKVDAPDINKLVATTIEPRTISRNAFSLEPHQILWDYWQRLRGDRDVARYDFIDPMHFNKAMGYVLLLEPNSDCTDFRYRVYGSVVAQRYGREMTGKWLSEFVSGTKDLSMLQYPALVQTKTPFYSEHSTITSNYNKTIWCRLAFPLENQKGKIDRILIGCVPVDKAIS